MWHFSYARDRTPTGNLTNITELGERAAGAMRQGWKLLCLTQDKTSDSGASYRPGYDHPRMWAQYASKHRGVCLVFDKLALEKAVTQQVGSRALRSGAVEYSECGKEDGAFLLRESDLETREVIDVARAHVELHWQTLFMTKDPDWAHECEFRFLMFDDAIEYEYVPIASSIRDIREVIIGADFPIDKVKDLAAHCQALEIDVRQISWRNGRPWWSPGVVYIPDGLSWKLRKGWTFPDGKWRAVEIPMKDNRGRVVGFRTHVKELSP